MIWRTLFSFEGTISRRAYFWTAVGGLLIKQVLDLGLASLAFHRDWTPLNYLVPLGVPVSLRAMTGDDIVFVGTMLLASLPFAWIGLAITAKRFRTIGWPTWTVGLFFVPIGNIVSFLAAAIWPEGDAAPTPVEPGFLSRVVPRDRLGAALAAALCSAVLSLAFVYVGTAWLNTYGWGLFAAIPFGQGALAVALAGARDRRSLGGSIAIAVLSAALALVGLLAVALEGVLCIAMAAPVVVALAIAGGMFAYVVQGPKSRRLDVATLIVIVGVAPGIMGAEAVVPRDAPTYMVRSEIVVDAPPMTVWRRVVAFPDLPPPEQLPFRIGIAYPERAHIVGSGVGAIRYCSFSTGDFVEPITAWEPGRRLAFRVARSAQPMREWSPYAGLDTPHLHGYLVSKHGEFDLEPLPGGKTRLIGITWYQHHLWPAGYWAFYSDGIIHAIHMQVLEHVKRLAEADRGNS